MAITEEHQKSRDGLRRDVYTKLYGRAKYVWAADDHEGPKDFTPETADGESNRFDKSAPLPQRPVLEHKNYIPPTPFDPDARNPYGSVLDAPLR